MYECTRHAILKNQANCDIITELDPDAPIRQRRVLHEQDTEDEQRFFRCVFELVRAGKPTEAQKLAIDQGYFMLAAGMEGWKAFRGNIRGTLTVATDGNEVTDSVRNGRKPKIYGLTLMCTRQIYFFSWKKSQIS